MLFLVTVFAFSLVFAGKAAEQTTKTSSKPLSVMIWDANQEPGIRKIIDDFTAQTGITAEIQVVNWDNYWTLLSAGAQGGCSMGLPCRRKGGDHRWYQPYGEALVPS
ncbi:MAG TPA: hypothetical protein VJ869_02050 [Sphaerochaeta sp.]|nr:hypothetical protein [Sphaerochaeta sp.]